MVQLFLKYKIKKMSNKVSKYRARQSQNVHALLQHKCGGGGGTSGLSYNHYDFQHGRGMREGGSVVICKCILQIP